MSVRHHRLARRRPPLAFADRLLVLTFLVGAALAIRPLVEDLVSSARARAVVSHMSVTADATSDARRLAALGQAQAYNRALGGRQAITHNQGMGGSNGGEADILTPIIDEADRLLPYDQQLRLHGADAMSWLEIPRIGLVLPIYHGTDQSALAQGVGHLETTSLPVGGMPSHCVLAAHSGMEETRMFDDLEQLSTKDHFNLHTLGDCYSYEIFATEVVTPQEAAKRCTLVSEEDLCTLVTCTPYGINSHRLLVHGRRVPAMVATESSTDAAVNLIKNRRSAPTLLLLGAAVLSGTSLHAARHLTRRRHTPHGWYGNRPSGRKQTDEPHATRRMVLPTPARQLYHARKAGGH